MAVDKNLFLHDLAIVAIMKNEGHYIKEWLDYHLLAGVDHFYIYDNDSPDNQSEVVKPYVAAGFVDYIPFPGKAMQMIAYNEALNRFKFQCRYMAFVDGDEFIFPKTTRSIFEVVDEIFSAVPNAGELSISCQCFGSNGQEKADYSRGVLERFTRRESKNVKPTNGCKCIADPRKIHHIESPHWVALFESFFPVTEDGKIKTCLRWILEPKFTEKIVVNHYRCMSREEYAKRAPRGRGGDFDGSKYSEEFFRKIDLNDEFDDGILKYRDERAKIYQPPDTAHADEKLLTALAKNLSPMILPTVPSSFYKGKLETFLTCRAVSNYLREKFPNDERLKFYEEASFKAILKSMTSMTFADARLLLTEMPNLLTLPYPEVKELHSACLNIISQMMKVMYLSKLWREHTELDYLQRLLQTWK